ncbi:hypothetical protein JTE90_009963 [Oedothorax gibbosus]|uniref:MADF domain-containing protein n=1 Tax=Oedothorax gibbosus TaxID=931172 RepID=A0AAV6V6S2_9ARAC|nr:hypothetical protein JTE90_009963 [Oedothorax gibbosus]
MERRILQEFIEIYRSEPSLWKVRSRYYNNRTVKEAAYLKLVTKLREIDPQADTNAVKKKINALRTNYRKEVRKIEASQAISGESTYSPSLWYFDLFHFISEDQDEDAFELQEGETFESELEADMQYDSDDFDEEYHAPSPEVSNHNLQNTIRTFSNNCRPSSSKRKRNFYNGDEDEQPRALQWSDASMVKHEPLDPQDTFGRYVASKLREMDKSQQILSERLISEVLFRGQMGLLSNKTCLSDDDLAPDAIKIEE